MTDKEKKALFACRTKFDTICIAEITAKKKRYALHPGIVTSKNDHDRHYISYHRLMELYCLRPDQCICWDSNRSETYSGRRWENYIHKYPLYSGCYPIFSE